MKNKILKLLWLLLLISFLFTGCEIPGDDILGDIPGIGDLIGDENSGGENNGGGDGGDSSGTAPSFSLDTIPEFDGNTAYVIINDNIPFFDGESTSSSYESYAALDSLGRCGVAIVLSYIGPIFVENFFY